MLALAVGPACSCDPKESAEGKVHSDELGSTATQRIQEELVLTKASEERGDAAAVIQHLEALKTMLEERPEAPAAGPLLVISPPGVELVPWLGRLYVEAGRLSDAERLYEGALSRASDLLQRDRVRNLQIELWSKRGTLKEHIAAKEPALVAKDADEADLRFLALAFNGGGAAVGLVSPGWANGGPAGSDLEKLVRTYERLYRLHAADAQIRQALISLYERHGDVDKAIRLLRESKDGPPVTGSSGDGIGPEEAGCPMGVVPRPTPAELATEAAVIGVLTRSGRDRQALVETRKLVALGRQKSLGAQAFTLGAHLYLGQNRPDIAAQTLAEGTKARRGVADRRELALAEADVLLYERKVDRLKVLLKAWKGSPDACLQTEAVRREPMLAAIRPPATGSGAP